jgi:hypothetical protein
MLSPSMRRTGFWCAATLALGLIGTAAWPQPPAPPSTFPKEYVGKWRGLFGTASTHKVNFTGTATVTQDFGHVIDEFSFEVAEDGSIKGTGKATYWFDIESDAELIVTRLNPKANLVGGKQQVEFDIEGTASADGKVQIRAKPRKQLDIINAGKRGQMGAWNVFGAFEETITKDKDRYVIAASHVIDGIDMKLDWKARKSPITITKLELNDIDDVALEYLSTDEHTYFGGNTRVHGIITVEGEPESKLESIQLEVLQDGAVVGTGKLATAAESELLNVAFGDDKKVEITASQLLFELPSSEAGNVNGSQNGQVLLRAKAKTTEGDETEEEFGNVEILVRFEGTRYGGRDEARGGDDWVKPSVRDVIEHFALTWGDASNMNAGSFSPDHTSHRTGNDVDGWFDGFNNRDAATAQRIIDILNDDTYGSRITNVFVTFRNAGQISRPEFWNAINGVMLDDGRVASNVITHEPSHTTHFHFRISD